MSKNIKCKNCGHVVEYREHPPFGDKPEWDHKSMLHNENCECRKPEPNWKPIQDEIEKDFDKIMKDYKPPRYDRSRGWDSIPLEEKLRPFTI